MHTDLLDTVDWAVEEGITDPEKVAATGGSYGGYATLWAMTESPDVFACGVAVVGPANLSYVPGEHPDNLVRRLPLGPVGRVAHRGGRQRP